MHGKAVLYTGAPGQRVKAHNDYIILEPNQSKSPADTAYMKVNYVHVEANSSTVSVSSKQLLMRKVIEF